jgi:Ca2+-binding RTX toxin-like protein
MANVGTSGPRILGGFGGGANVAGTDGDDVLDLFDGVTNQGDVILGLGGNDTIFGFGGNDIIDGGGGADRIDGGAGNDDIFGGAGADRIDGGFGSDTADYRGSAAGVVVDLGTGTGNGGDAVGDTLVNIENLIGSDHDDVLIGDVGANTFTAGQGNDVLKGGGGADGLIGQSGNDNLKGGGGTDTLVGGLGQDLLAGGTESDIFVWTSTAETAVAGDEADVVTDFALGDLLVLDQIDADGNAANGNQAFTFVGVVDFASSFFTGAGQIGFFTSGTDTFILINTTVDAGPVDFEEATIRLNGVHAIDAGFFVL